jgi:ATP-dependent DNA ligase
MLARLARELPVGDYLYEPKWDGFSLPGVCGGRGRRAAEMAWPPAHALLSDLTGRSPGRGRAVIMDGEILSAGGDFTRLLSRIHPAGSRVERLRDEAPARFMAFDMLAFDGEDLRERPFGERRRALETVLADPPRGGWRSPVDGGGGRGARLARAAGRGTD